METLNEKIVVVSLALGATALVALTTTVLVLAKFIGI